MSGLFQSNAAEDPFGSVLPDGYEPLGPDAPIAKRRDKARSLEQQLANPDPKKKADHSKRTREFYERLGYTVVRVDQTRVNYVGATYTVDFMGLFDFMAFSDKCTIGIQVCNRGHMKGHEAAMCGTEVTSFNKARKCDNLRAWLSCPGRKAVIITWKKPGRLWEADVFELTMETLKGYDARRRTKC